MASKSGGSFMGDYHGRVGPVVLTGWMNIDVLKSRPATGKFRRNQTEKQVEQTTLFGKVNTLLASLRTLFVKSFPKPKNANMSPLNAAVSGLMTNALIEHEGKRYIDFNLIKLSKPKDRTQQLWNPEVAAQAGRKITVSWELNPFPQKCTQEDDLVNVAFCSVQDPKFVLVPKKVQRSQLSISFNAEISLIGYEMYIFIVVISADGKRVAESDYLGSIIVSE